MEKVVTVTSSGRCSQAGREQVFFLLTSDSYAHSSSPLCPAALGLGSPFRVDSESGARAPLLGGVLRLVSGTRLAGLGMAEGTGSRLEGLAAAPCGRDRR